MPVNIGKITGDTRARAQVREKKKGGRKPRIIRVPGWKIASFHADVGGTSGRPVIPAVHTDTFRQCVSQM